jgi:hypothetical protein
MTRGSPSCAGSLRSCRWARSGSCPSPTRSCTGYGCHPSGARPGSPRTASSGYARSAAGKGSDDDAFEWFAELHQDGQLLPTEDDRLRDQAEEALRSFGRLKEALFDLVDGARADLGTEEVADLDGWLPSRAIACQGDGVEEIWCAISVRAVEGNFIRAEVRDLLCAALEEHLAPAVFEARSDWLAGDVGWFEAVRLGMR